MTEEKKAEKDSPPIFEFLANPEVSKDSVISGDDKIKHQQRFFDVKAEENQDSPSDLSLKALNPDDPEYANLLSNRFEIVDENPHPLKAEKPKQYETDTRIKLQPGESRAKLDCSRFIFKEDGVSQEFYQKVVDAWSSLPEKERNAIEAARVNIFCKNSVTGEDGSPAVFYPEENSFNAEIHIGMLGRGGQGPILVRSENRDIPGSLKHEVGHAFFEILKVADKPEFLRLFESELAQIPPDYLKDNPSTRNKKHIFGECYATIRGRESPRVDNVKKFFPNTLEYVENLFESL